MISNNSNTLLQLLPFGPALTVLLLSALPLHRALLARIGGIVCLVGGALQPAFPEIIDIHWQSSGSIPIRFLLTFNQHYLLVSALVNYVLGAVLFFSSSYIASKHRYYYPLLGLFALGMHTLVFSGNLVSFILGWEVIGLTSYALISTYSNQPGVGKNALSVFLSNRVGDLVLLSAACASFAFASHAGREGLAFPTFSATLWLCSLLLLAALIKSAQWPFSFWLKHAMVGPTPVSALLHAATLVLGGVVLIDKFNPALISLKEYHLEYLLVGLAIIAMLRAITDRDLKRMLAGSTIAQMGLLMAAAFVQNPNHVYHILGHGLFKAELFLLIATLHHLTIPETPMTVRQLWEVFTRSNTFSKTLFIAALLGLCSLAGLPLLGTGIVKDLLLTNLAKGNTYMGFLLIGYLVLNTLFTARFGLGLLTRLAEGHRPHWLGGWQLFAISLLTIPQVFIHLFLPQNTETHYSWMIFSMISFAAILALMYKPRLFYPQLQHIAGVRMPTVNITGNSLKSILAFVALPNQLLDRIPLIFARAGVIASHTLHLSERIVVEALRIGFKATLFPIRFMVVDVIHLRLSRVLFYAILVLAASLYFLA